MSSSTPLIHALLNPQRYVHAVRQNLYSFSEKREGCWDLLNNRILSRLLRDLFNSRDDERVIASERVGVCTYITTASI